VGATIFVFAPNLVAVGTHGHGSRLVDSAYAPLLLLLASRWMRRGGLADVSGLALAGGFQILRGHVQICFYTWLAVGLYALIETAAALARAPEPGEPRQVPQVLARAAGIGVAAALAFGIAGFYSLPLHDYARYSIRGGGEGGGVGIDYASQWSLAPYELPEIAIPGWVGFGSSTYWGGMPFTDYPNAYVGMIAVLLLLPAGFVRPAGSGAWPVPRVWAAGIALFSLMVAFGSYFPLYRFLYDHLPLFNKFRIPVMIVLLFQVAVALGAAWGWSAVLSGRSAAPEAQQRADRVLLAAAIVIGGTLLVGIVARDAWHDDYVRWALEHRGRSLRFGSENFGVEQAAAAWRECFGSFVRAGLLGLLALGVAWLARRGGGRNAATAALLALVLIELWPVSGRVMSPVIGEPTPRGVDVGRDDTIDFLEHAGPPGSFRILPIDEFQSNRFATFGIASLGGYHAAKPRRFQDFVERHLSDNSWWMRLLNVRYIVSRTPYETVPPALRVVHQGAAQILEFPAALPRVTVVGAYQVVSPGAAILDSVSSGRRDSGTLTYLERDLGLRLGPVEGARAVIESYRLNDVAIAVDTPGPGLVRLADLWYPDWVATVDGRPAEILRADYLLRAVPVPAGRHRVEFHYRSRVVRLGLQLSVASLIVVLAGFAAAAAAGGLPTRGVPAPGAPARGAPARGAPARRAGPGPGPAPSVQRRASDAGH